jgi:hypothetical protein
MKRKSSPAFLATGVVAALSVISLLWFVTPIRNAIIEITGKAVMNILMGGEITPSKGKVLVRYNHSPVPSNLNNAEVEAKLAKLKHSLFFLGYSSEGRVRLECDRFMIPNGKWAKVEAEWFKVTAEGGSEIWREHSLHFIPPDDLLIRGDQGDSQCDGRSGESI